MSRHALHLREQPHRAEHDAALITRMADGIRPTSLVALLGWYAKGLGSELPAELHEPGVWRDYGEAGVGGSALGSPKWSYAFRRYIEGSRRQTDTDGMYLYPVGAALAHLDKSCPRVVTWLSILAMAGFDYRRAADFAHKAHDEAKAQTFGALTFLWEAVYPSPPLSMGRSIQETAA